VGRAAGDLKVGPPLDLGPLNDRLCEDTPAWWLLKKKKTMYHNGQISARSVRSLMSFMLSPLTGRRLAAELEDRLAAPEQAANRSGAGALPASLCRF